MQYEFNREISTFVRDLLPGASDRELEEAQDDYEGYLDALMRMFERLEREGRFD